MNENIYDEYKANRQNHTVPARLALGWTRQRLELLARMARLQFAWAIRDGQCHQARWKQDGFDIRAVVIGDPDGWFDTGIFMYGRFANQWQAGAVRYWQGNGRSCQWFVPADFGYRHEYYRRTCDFGVASTAGCLRIPQACRQRLCFLALIIILSCGSSLTAAPLTIPRGPGNAMLR